MVIEYITDKSHQTSLIKGSYSALHSQAQLYRSSNSIIADVLSSCVGPFYSAHLFLVFIFKSSTHNLRGYPEPSASSAPPSVSFSSSVSIESEERSIKYAEQSIKYEEVLTNKPSLHPTSYPTSKPTINDPEEILEEHLIDEKGEALFNRTVLVVFIFGCCICGVSTCVLFILFVIPKWTRVAPTIPIARGELLSFLKDKIVTSTILQRQSDITEVNQTNL